MQIKKHEIIKMLRARGDNDNADRAEKELPDQVNPEEHRGLLEQFGVATEELMTKLRSRS